MKRLRVAEVVEATENGTKKHVLELMRRVDRSRFELELVASDRRDPKGFARDVDALVAEGFAVHLVPMTRAVNLFADFRALVRLVRLFHRRRYDVVHCHSSKAGFLGRLAALLTARPWVVYTPHCFSFTAGFGRFVGWCYQALEFLAGRVTDRLIAVSPHEREVAIHSGAALPHQVVTIVNGLDDGELVERRAKASLRRELGIPLDAPVVGSIGRLGRQKGYDVFLRAAQLLHDDRPDVHFLLVGKGSYEASLKALSRELGIERVVHFAGERDDVLDIFPLLDVFVLSSRWEAMPYSLLEAMGAARAIVMTRIAGLESVVDYGRAAVIIPPEDPDALAEAVARLLVARARREALGRAAREIASARYRLGDSIRRIEEVYSEGRHERNH